MQIVRSADSTSIALDHSGRGAPVVLVNGALGDRSASSPLAGLLTNYRVFTYDRRGRGESGDSAAYAVEREIEDLAAVLAVANGPTCVYGTSSGANLVLRAAASGVTMRRIALWEPNFLVDDSRPPLPADYVTHLNDLVAANRRGDAIEYFMTAAVGVPAEWVAPMRAMPHWDAMEAVANSLAYDGSVVRDDMAGRPVDPTRWETVDAAALVLDGGQTRWMTAGADAIADALPNARRLTLEGQTHDVAPEPLAAALVGFFGPDAQAGRRGERA
jgi:alpha-beta hydrolase superfamily lysophospholipase